MGGISEKQFARAFVSRWSIVLLSCALILNGACHAPKEDLVTDPAVPPSTTESTVTEAVETVAIPTETTATEEPRRDFLDAVSKGIIDYEVVGTGASSGQSLALRIRRTVPREVVVFIEPGTVFRTLSADVQDMVAYGVAAVVNDSKAEETGVPPLELTDTIRLVDDEPRIYSVEAYCLNFDLENPSARNTFVAQAIDQRAATVLRAAKAESFSVAATQSAIWMDRDHVTKEEIQAKFEVTDQELEDAWQLLMKLPPPT